MARKPWDAEPKHVVRALAPLRRGTIGERREAARQMLLALMGFGPREVGRFRAGVNPGYQGPNVLPEDEATELAAVAEDMLLELGYEAAAMQLRTRSRSGLWVSARHALGILEAGPPSVWLRLARTPWVGDAVFTSTIRRYRYSPYNDDYLVGRKVDDPRWWYRYAVGGPTWDQRGQPTGWDPDAGYTFQRRGRTLADVLAAKYGSVALTEADRIDGKRRGRRG